jgi:tetratricopeptide (TPR) repeat protein
MPFRMARRGAQLLRKAAAFETMGARPATPVYNGNALEVECHLATHTWYDEFEAFRRYSRFSEGFRRSRTMLSEVSPDHVSSSAPRRFRGAGSAWIGGLSFWTVTLALIGLNVWWTWDKRPLESLSTISGWIDQNRLTDAESETRRWLRQTSHHGQARILLSRVLAARGDFLNSAKQLHEVPVWWPAKGEVLFLEGQNFLKANRARDAEAAWKATLADDPLHPIPAASVTAAALELTKLYVLEGRDDEAREVLWRRYGLAESSGVQFFLAKLLRLDLERATPEDAAATLLNYVKATPDDWEARRALARAEQSLGQRELASRNIQACLKAQPNDLGTWRDWLAILVAQNDLNGLTAAVAKLPSGADRDGRCWKYRGLARVHHQEWRQAVDAFEQSLKLNPGDAECHNRLAQIAEQLGDPNKAAWHRQQSQILAAASAELPAALNKALLSIRDALTNPPPVFARLVALYKTLGYTQRAEAWSRFISQSGP